MSDKEQGDEPKPGQVEGEEPTFGDAFSERASNPAGDRKEAGAGDEPTPNAAAEAAASDAPADAAAEPNTSGPKPQGFDPWAGMTPEQKAHFEKLQASERSNRGRVGALTKKLNATTSPTRAAAPADRGEEQPTERKPEESEAAALDERLKRAREEYGDVIGPVADVIDELRAEISTLKASATRHQVEEDAEAITAQLAELESKHKDYREYNGENPDYVEWFSQQPANIQSLANSFDAREVSLALTLFKAERGISSDAGAEPTKGEDDAGTAQGDKRRRQLEGSRQVSTRGVPAAGGVPNDFKSAFHARAKAQT